MPPVDGNYKLYVGGNLIPAARLNNKMTLNVLDGLLWFEKGFMLLNCNASIGWSELKKDLLLDSASAKLR